jgi:site-specific recombinase
MNWMNFRTFGASDFIISPNVKELIFSMNILSWRVTGMAMEVEVVRMAPQYRNLSNPFLALQNELEALADDLVKDQSVQLHSKDSSYKQIKIYAEQCLEFVNIAFKTLPNMEFQENQPIVAENPPAD